MVVRTSIYYDEADGVHIWEGDDNRLHIEFSTDRHGWTFSARALAALWPYAGLAQQAIDMVKNPPDEGGA